MPNFNLDHIPVASLLHFPTLCEKWGQGKSKYTYNNSHQQQMFMKQGQLVLVRNANSKTTHALMVPQVKM